MEETSRAPLTFHLLGEPEISYRDHALSALLAGKEQALLIYLACNPGRRFSRDHLATLLWGETSQERARYNLRRALWHVREALEERDLSPDDHVSTEDSWIWMPMSAPFWLDTQEFEEVLGRAFRHLRTEFSPASVGVRRVRETIDLYRGKFLAGFSVSQAPGFDEWVLFERERLFQLLLRALGSLIQSFIAWGEREILAIDIGVGEEDVLVLMTFPPEHWPHIYLTNLLEGVNRVAKRTTSVVDIFPDTELIVEHRISTT